MKTESFLFCGGPSIKGENLPKPLLKVRPDQTLLSCFLAHLVEHRQLSPDCVTLLCDTGQEQLFEDEVAKSSYPFNVRVQACGSQASTFDKLETALNRLDDTRSTVHFGYPDIFFFGNPIDFEKKSLGSGAPVMITAAPLTSRFPRLVVDIYTNEVKGISNYSAPFPANPMYVFGGDLWGCGKELLHLVREFKLDTNRINVTLEYDFFFWLINHKKMRCVMLVGERVWVDSDRDIRNLQVMLGRS